MSPFACPLVPGASFRHPIPFAKSGPLPPPDSRFVSPSEPLPMTDPEPVADATIPPVADEPESRPWGLPLYVWVILAVVLAIPVGLALGVDAERAAGWPDWLRSLVSGFIVGLDLIPTLIIRALGALAAPLVVLAILSAIVTNDIRGRQGARMMSTTSSTRSWRWSSAWRLTNLIQPGQGPTSAARRPRGGPTTGDAADRRCSHRLIDPDRRDAGRRRPPKTDRQGPDRRAGPPQHRRGLRHRTTSPSSCW